MIFKLIAYFRNLRSSFIHFLNESSGLVLFPFKKKYLAFLVLTLSSILVFLNTLGHQMSDDDQMVIQENDLVLKGFSGIPDILTHETYHSFNKHVSSSQHLFDCSYRPLSVISFAIEQQFAGTKPENVPVQFAWDVNQNGQVDPDEDTNQDHIFSQDDFFARGIGLRHFNNIIIFALCVGLIYVFFSKYTPSINPDIVFTACLLFALHPIHTEVISTISGRDQLFSLSFLLFTIIFACRYLGSSRKIDLVAFSISFLLALFSKEYALTLFLIFPLFIYLYRPVYAVDATVKTWFYFIIGALVSLSVYLYERWTMVSSIQQSVAEQMNSITNPFFMSTDAQQWTTKCVILLNYIKLMFLPFPLISDYSFHSMAFHDFAYVETLMFLVVLSLFLSVTIYLLWKRKPIAFPLMLLLVWLLPESNLFNQSSSLMSERTIFHASLGFCFLLAWPLNIFLSVDHPITKSRLFAIRAFILLIAIGAFLTSFVRNRDFETNQSLMFADLPKAPDNVRLLSGVANTYYEKATNLKNKKEQRQLVEKSNALIRKGFRLDKGYVPFYQTLSLNHYLIKQYDSSETIARTGLTYEIQDEILNSIIESISREYIFDGLKHYKLDQKDSALICFDKALQTNPRNADAYYNKSVVLKQQGDTLQAIELLHKAMLIEAKPEFKSALDKLKSQD